MRSIFSTFERYYSPLWYKLAIKSGKETPTPKAKGMPIPEERSALARRWKRLQASYLEKALATTSNEEFWRVQHRFFAEFFDAHTRYNLGISDLPGVVNLAYLGFSGERKGSKYLVNELIPGLAGGSFPIQPGDEITHIDGKPVNKATLAILEKFQNLGQPESNLTLLMNSLFTRISIEHPMPTSETAKIKILRDGQPFEFELPWIKKDFYTFLKENASEEGKKASRAKKRKQVSVTLQTLDGGRLDVPSKPSDKERTAVQQLLESFRLPEYFYGWSTKPPKDSETAWQVLKRERDLPAHAIRFGGAKHFPAFIRPERLPTGRVAQVGVLRIPTFSPDGTEEEVLNQLQATIDFFQTYGVKDLIVDTLDNGGGSVSLVLKVAQALSRKKIKVPDIEIGVNESWMESLRRDAANAPSDADRAIAKSLLARLERAKNQKRVTADAVSLEALIPWQLQGNEQIEKPFRIALLQNEMVASAGDLFAHMIKENGLGTPIGSRTMGAGGNVIAFPPTLASNAAIQQTASLLVVKDGKRRRYLENQGVPADIQADTVAGDRHESVYQAALEHLFPALAKTREAISQLSDENVEQLMNLFGCAESAKKIARTKSKK